MRASTEAERVYCAHPRACVSVGLRTNSRKHCEMGDFYEFSAAFVTQWSVHDFFCSCGAQVFIPLSGKDLILFTDARYWYSNSVRLSVHSSVRDVPVSDENGLTYCDSFFSPYGSPIILALPAPNIFTKFRRGHPCGGDKYRWGIKISQFSTSRYLADNTR